MDWRDKRNHNCNGRWNHTGTFYNDGLDVDPLEVMFVKVRAAAAGRIIVLVSHGSQAAGVADQVVELERPHAA